MKIELTAQNLANAVLDYVGHKYFKNHLVIGGNVKIIGNIITEEFTAEVEVISLDGKPVEETK